MVRVDAEAVPLNEVAKTFDSFEDGKLQGLIMAYKGYSRSEQCEMKQL